MVRVRIYVANIFSTYTTKQYTSCSYSIALKKLGVQTQSFERDCCRDAVEMLSKMGFNTTKCPRTVSNWNIVFR